MASWAPLALVSTLPAFVTPSYLFAPHAVIRPSFMARPSSPSQLSASAGGSPDPRHALAEDGFFRESAQLVVGGAALLIACAALPACASDTIIIGVDPAALTTTATAAALPPAEPAALAGAIASAAPAVAPTMQEILAKAGRRALGGGVSGALAGVFQVLSLMWLRTTMNYQYRFGTSTADALRTLYGQGGISRLYQGLPFALVQTPLSRFGDTAANTGILALLVAIDSPLPMAARTAVASAAAATWRIGLTPLDTLKTTMQVEGAEGYGQVREKVAAEGPTVLFQGALANAAASFVGNYPWYLTFNTLDGMLPIAPQDELLLKLGRLALLGVSAACVSDCISNGIRVLKTTRQTSSTTISYQDALAQVLERDGWQGLLTRGLQTRLLTNSLQAAIFTVLWKYLEEELGKAGFF